MKSLAALIVALSFLGVGDSRSWAGLIVMGNLPAPNDGFGATIDAGTDNVGTNFIHVVQAISFTMPGQGFPVERLTVRLQQYNTTTGDVAAVRIQQDNGSDLPGTVVGAFTNPTSSSDSVASFVFFPASPLQLAAATKYWLVLDAAAGEYSWQGANLTPTSQVGATFGSMIGIVGTEKRDVDGIASFEILTSVPEPSTPVLGGLGLALLAARRRTANMPHGMT